MVTGWTCRAKGAVWCAAGKLGLVKKEGSDPRLVGDNAISHADLLCRIMEKVELPCVCVLVIRWTAFSLNVAKAHKGIRFFQLNVGIPSLWLPTGAARSIGLSTIQRISALPGQGHGGRVPPLHLSLCPRAYSWKSFSRHHEAPILAPAGLRWSRPWPVMWFYALAKLNQSYVYSV